MTKYTPRVAASKAIALLVVTLCASVAGGVRAEDKWAITGFTGRGVDASTRGVFRDMLRDQIQQREGVTFVDVAAECGETQCARDAAGPTGAKTVVFGSLDALGQKLIVSVRSADVASGTVAFSQSMSVARVEELDVAAKRMADALTSGDDVESNMELGTVTKEEAKVPNRRGTRFAFLLGLHGLLPQTGFAERTAGAGFSVGVFVETTNFLIEPTLGYRRDLAKGDEGFGHVPLEIAMAYLFSQTDVAPLLGAGLGLGILDETYRTKHTVGDLLPSTTYKEVDDKLFGFTVFPRVGVLFLRTYGVSLELAADYLFTFADFEERSVEHGLRFGFNLILGGG